MKKCVIIGGGFSGLTLAFELLKNKFDVTILEKERYLGGLASGFEVFPNVFLERFYHHWFSNDLDVLALVSELDCEKNLIKKESNTGFYYNKSFYKLSSPVDLLKFKLLSFTGRLRLGFFTLFARRIKDFTSLENISALEWCNKVCGAEVTSKVWEPLIKGKFGEYYDKVSAVWLWNKVKLRGSSRNRFHHEILYYYKGGFQSLINHWKDKLEKMGARILLDSNAVKLIESAPRKINGVLLSNGTRIDLDYIFITAPLPDIIKLLPDSCSEKNAWDVPFLANRCLILLLKQSLSEIYWLNVADPTFPFVGVIEHTNLDDPSNYKDGRLAYLSRYMPSSDPLYLLSSDDYFYYCFEHLKKMFPAINESFVINFWDWKAQYAQPVVVTNYRSKIPPFHLRDSNIFISTMAQIYPEDRGTNYAVKYSKKVFDEFKTFLNT